MTSSFYNPGGYHATDPRMTDYHAAITREYPTWTATITGGRIPEPGHVVTSLSYARLWDEIQDWLEWHYDHQPALGDDQADYEDDSADDGADDGAGEGFRILSDYHFTQPVSDAQERYWQTRRQLAQSRADMRQAIWDLHDGLRASVEDLARLLCLPPRKVRRILGDYELELVVRESREGKS